MRCKSQSRISDDYVWTWLAQIDCISNTIIHTESQFYIANFEIVLMFKTTAWVPIRSLIKQDEYDKYNRNTQIYIFAIKAKTTWSKCVLRSMWPNDTICCRRSGPTPVQHDLPPVRHNHLNQCGLIVNRNKFLWSISNALFIQEDAFQNTVCKMSTIFISRMNWRCGILPSINSIACSFFFCTSHRNVTVQIRLLIQTAGFACKTPYLEECYWQCCNTNA